MVTNITTIVEMVNLVVLTSNKFVYNNIIKYACLKQVVIGKIVLRVLINIK